jgi:hypothetical protein
MLKLKELKQKKKHLRTEILKPLLMPLIALENM